MATAAWVPFPESKRPIHLVGVISPQLNTQTFCANKNPGAPEQLRGYCVLKSVGSEKQRLVFSKGWVSLVEALAGISRISTPYTASASALNGTLMP